MIGLREPSVQALWDITTPDGADRRFRDDIFNQLPYRFRKPAASRYRDAFNSGGIANANGLLLDVSAVVNGAAGRIAGNDTELCEWAEKNARNCEKVAASLSDQDSAYLVLCETATRGGIVPPVVEERMTVTGAIKRLCCAKWWRRQARKSQGRGVEGAAIALHMVHRHAELYASDESVERRAGQKRRNRLMLESCLAVNELGEQFSLAELADLSVSNPSIRRGELMTRMAGFEAVAQKNGHAGEFYTWTTPSRMHAHLSARGAHNPLFDGTTPRQAQQYLCGQWAKARASLARKNISLYGFRVCEPHHDGTPHWHMLFFMSPDHSHEVRRVLRHYALQFDGNESGAVKHRFTAVRIDPNRGTAAGYLAKYVAKNIDGFGMGSIDDDLYGRNPEACAARVDAWASTWGIRQFQQVGGASVTVWRELRRLRDAVEDVGIESARQSADVGDWAGYLDAQGGATAKRKHMPVTLLKEWSDEPGAYGDAVGYRVLGVECGAAAVVTRVREWVLKVGFSGGSLTKSGHDASWAIPGTPLDFLPSGSAGRSWSPVNNCTVGVGNGSSNTSEKIGAGGGKTASVPARGACHAVGTRVDPGTGTAERRNRAVVRYC